MLCSFLFFGDQKPKETGTIIDKTDTMLQKAFNPHKSPISMQSSF